MSSQAPVSFVHIAPPAFDIEYDPAYARADNFIGRVFYRHPCCLLHPEAAARLKTAIEIAFGRGWKLRLYDAYRPIEVQRAFWQALPDETYIANPHTTASPHNRGVAIDLTLVDRLSGQALPMGTGFDEMIAASAHTAPAEIIGAEAFANRQALLAVMTEAGFKSYVSEWWHYHLPESRTYPIIADGEAGPRLC